MTTIIQILTAAALVLSIIVPFGAFFLGEKTKKTLQKISCMQLLFLLWKPSCSHYCNVRRNSQRSCCNCCRNF